ncbi:MAG TPA: hypothetical protein PLK12_02285 [Prolixibacteraceae bacterium]|nr:hypothetical protein [Prolixibacteraceae bacterium]
MKGGILFLVCFPLLLSFPSYAQTSYTYTANGTFTPPAGVTSVTGQAWGGGGGGGSGSAFIGTGRGGGGGGGAFNSGTLSVTPGTSYAITIGQGGTSGNNGGATSFGSLLSANGGNAGVDGVGVLGSGNGSGGSGGAAGTWAGGNGATATGSGSGGGGGGAGSSSTGGNGSVPTGGSGGTGSGGTGGNGRTSNGDGGSGSIAGGGGGGGYYGGFAGLRDGGSGARGQLTLTWTCPTYSFTSLSGQSICSPATSSSVTLNGNAANLPTGTYTVTYNTTNPTQTGLTATMTISTAGTGTFTVTGLTGTAPITSVVTVTRLASGTYPGGSCCQSDFSSGNTASIIKAVSSPAQPGTINGPATVCSGASGETYSISSVQYASSYSWSVPSGWTITAGQGTTEITVDAGSSGGDISVTANNGCGSSSPRSLTIGIYPDFTAGAIETSGETICYGDDPSEIGSDTDASGGDNSISYEWRSSADGYTDPISGATASSYTPPSGLTQTSSYRRYASDGSCHTTPSQSTGTWTVTVHRIAATVELESGDNECPDLEASQGFNPDNNGPYNAGATAVTFTVTRVYSSAATWGFIYTLDGTNISVPGSSPNPATGTINNIGDDSYDITFWMTNVVNTPLTATLTIDEVFDSHGCNDTSAPTDDVDILAMPAVGPFQ